MGMSPIGKRPVVVACAAIALLGASTVIGMNMFATGARDVVEVQAGGHEFAARRTTMEAASWLSARGRLYGLKFAPDAGDGEQLRIHLVPAPGVEIPRGSFEASAIRFNEAGEVVEIVPAEAASSCQVVGFEDPDEPGRYFVSCIGGCTTPGLRCTLTIDIVTLQLDCPCM